MPTDEELKRAMKAFKRRVKLTCLDEESRLGHGPLSGGEYAGAIAITPPREFSKEVWDELVARGQLSRDNDGFYRQGTFKGGLS